jgi:hypothetical protein
MKHSRWLLAAALAGAAACAESPDIDKPRADMTQRERDSTVASSGLPGARVVGSAMQTADAEARRAAAFDSASAQ